MHRGFFQKSLFSGVFGLVCSGGLVANRRENLYFSNFHSTAPIQTCQHFLWILSLSPNCDKLSLSQKSSAVQTIMLNPCFYPFYVTSLVLSWKPKSNTSLYCLHCNVFLLCKCYIQTNVSSRFNLFVISFMSTNFIQWCHIWSFPN